MSRDHAHRRLIDDLLAIFGGRSLPVLSHLIESGNLTLEDVKEAEEMLRKAGRTESPSERCARRSPLAVHALPRNRGNARVGVPECRRPRHDGATADRRCRAAQARRGRRGLRGADRRALRAGVCFRTIPPRRPGRTPANRPTFIVFCVQTCALARRWGGRNGSAHCALPPWQSARRWLWANLMAWPAASRAAPSGWQVRPHRWSPCGLPQRPRWRRSSGSPRARGWRGRSR